MPTVSQIRIFIHLIVMGILLCTGHTSRAEGPFITFDIAAQPMAGALQTLAQQADLQILFTVSDVNALTAPPITGRMSSEDALQRLLHGTTLECIRNGDVLVVRERAVTRTSVQGGGGQGGILRIAQTSPAPAAEIPATREEEHGKENQGEPESQAAQLGETVVTGSWIRGASTASPLIRLDANDIDRTGYTTLHQVVERLPQNYGGGDAEGTVLTPGGSFLNVAMGSAVNLRGLGSDSTLVLLNGRRLAPAAYGQFVDLSMIPLSAVERIEVLTDGASATYGSDAVAGVVNIRLREDYAGAETRLKGGMDSYGAANEYQLGQTFGAQWNTGGGLLTYEYYERDHLDSRDRDYSDPALDPYDLFAEQERHSLLGALHQDLSASTQLYGTALWSERDALWQQADFFTGEPQSSPSQTTQWSATLGIRSDFAESWQADLAASYGRNDTHRDLTTLAGTRPAERNRFDVSSLELNLDGALFELGGEPVRTAIGGAWREETYDSLRDTLPESNRTVTAAFAEVIVPLIGATSQILELSLAGRYENYSDFGSTTNPKLGLLWQPNERVRLRSTWGTSFRAPLLTELDDSNVVPVLLDFPDPAASDGTTLTMLQTGNSPDLQPEEATTWTAGVDFTLGEVRGTRISLTYFDTEFEDRIMQPLPGFEIFTLFEQTDIYESLITRDPDDAFIAALAADPEFQNGYGPFAPSDVEVYFDRRLQNLSLTSVSGVDLAFASRFDTAVGDWTASLDGTYLLDFTNAVTPTAPDDDVLDTAYNPIDLRLRAGLAWTRGPWSATAFVNYSDGYTNDTVTPSTGIDSWTTVDLQFTYDAPWLEGVRFALSCTNALDEDPPFLDSPIAFFDIGYDPTNASPMGRFLSLAVTATW